MELRHLRYFVAVAEELHFRRAAERLYVAQPAVSEQIRKLEGELGVRLFERTHRTVSLTDAGAAMLEEARRVLRQAEIARTAAVGAGNRTNERLRIGYLPGTLPDAVPRALRAMSSLVPDVQVLLETGPAMRLVDDVRNRNLDAAVVGLPTAASGLRATRLEPEAPVVAMPARDALATRAPLTLERLAPRKVVTMTREANRPHHDTVHAMCRRAGLAPDIVEVAEPRMELVLLAVAAGAGVALLPASVAERYAIPGVRFVDLAESELAFESAVVSHPDTHGPSLPALLALLARPERRRRSPVLARPALGAAA